METYELIAKALHQTMPLHPGGYNDPDEYARFDGKDFQWEEDCDTVLTALLASPISVDTIRFRNLCLKGYEI